MSKKLLDKPTLTVNDLAKKYKVSVLEVKKQLLKGIKVEKEHTDHPKIAREIALDHLGERLDYYTKLHKAHLEEETGTAGVRGLGYVTGDPGIDPVSQYVNTNAMSYEDENGNKLEYIKRQHADLHNRALGFNFFDPTKTKTLSNFMNEATTTLGGLGGIHSPQGEGDKYLDNNVKGTERDADIREKHAVGIHHSLHADNGFNTFRHTNVKSHSNKELKEAREKVTKKLDELGGMTGYEGISAPRNLRANDQLEEGPLKDKAKKVALAGLTAANMYTLADVAGRATEGGHGSPKADIVRATTAAPGLVGWGATALHYGNKGYKLARDALHKKKKGHMEEEKKMSNPCWKGYKAYGMKKKNGKEVPNCVPVEEEQIDELHQDTIWDYSDKALTSLDKSRKVGYKKDFSPKPGKKAAEARKTFDKRDRGLAMASKRLGGVFDESAAWQRSAGKDPEGGLNRKGIASYRASHPGSHLSMAVTKKPSELDPDGKAAKRRKSFCARMGGMKGPMKDEKGRPTRKALALRKWNCEEQNALPQTAERGIYEISAELVGKVSNERFWRGEAPSKTLTRAINKKYVESGKKEETPKKQVKENSKDKDWDDAVGFMGKGDVAEQKHRTEPSHVHLNKPDVKYAPGATGVTHTIHEETTMENENLVNEAIENILENDLVSMKENLMVALQEKAQEKLEERKKEIAANYFAQ